MTNNDALRRPGIPTELFDVIKNKLVLDSYFQEMPNSLAYYPRKVRRQEKSGSQTAVMAKKY